MYIHVIIILSLLYHHLIIMLSSCYHHVIIYMSDYYRLLCCVPVLHAGWATPFLSPSPTSAGERPGSSMVYRLFKSPCSNDNFCKKSFYTLYILQGVQEKLCFFAVHCNPSLAYIIAVRYLQSTHRSASVQSLLLAGLCTTNSSRVLARERWQSFENSWEKTQYLMNTPYLQ